MLPHKDAQLLFDNSNSMRRYIHAYNNDCKPEKVRRGAGSSPDFEFWEDSHSQREGPTWNDSQEVIPATTHAASVLLNQLPHGDAQLLLYGHWVVHMSADAEQLGAIVVLTTEAGEPLWASAKDGGGHCNRLDICDSGGAAPEANVGGEGWLQPGLPLLAL